jgi:hypothetical protein
MGIFVKYSFAVGLVLFLIYIACMLVYPAIVSKGDWSHIQAVWERWQSLNVGILALLSSLVALNISTYLFREQRKREFRAAKAYLPMALSQLCRYTQQSADFYKIVWDCLNNKLELSALPPEEANDYKPVFSECIKNAPPDVGEWMSEILRQIQVHHARMTLLNDDLASCNYSELDKVSLISYLKSLIELRALINRLFPFARSQANFDGSHINYGDLDSASNAVNIIAENFTVRLSATGNNFSLDQLLRAAD